MHNYSGNTVTIITHVHTHTHTHTQSLTKKSALLWSRPSCHLSMSRLSPDLSPSSFSRPTPPLCGGRHTGSSTHSISTARLQRECRWLRHCGRCGPKCLPMVASQHSLLTSLDTCPSQHHKCLRRYKAVWCVYIQLIVIVLCE